MRTDTHGQTGKRACDTDWLLWGDNHVHHRADGAFRPRDRYPSDHPPIIIIIIITTIVPPSLPPSCPSLFSSTIPSLPPSDQTQGEIDIANRRFQREGVVEFACMDAFELPAVRRVMKEHETVGLENLPTWTALYCSFAQCDCTAPKKTFTAIHRPRPPSPVPSSRPLRALSLFPIPIFS